MTQTVIKNIVLFFILLFSVKVYSQDQIIKSGDEWFFYEDGSLDTKWFLNSTDYKNWKKGITPIGYGDKKVVTNISFGSDENKKHIVKYFKKSVTLHDPNEYLAYGFQFKRDDGIIIYVNGKEVYRNNLPLGTLTDNTLAIHRIDSDKESEILFSILDVEKFKKGSNIISIAIHQASQSSSDCIFDFDMFGYKDPKILSDLISLKSQKNNALETQVKSLNTNLLLEKSALQLQVQEARSENLTFILFIIILLFAISIGVIILLLVNSKKKEQQTNANIDSLMQEMKVKDQELMTLNTKLLHSRQYFKEIKADIKGLKNNNESIIKDINYHINTALDNDNDWINFQKHFDAVYSGFYDNLLKEHPSLSEIELRHCMFIKLHMQTKEIAKILLIDPRSVQTARYRIKKKMHLSEETDLRAYLLNLI